LFIVVSNLAGASVAKAWDPVLWCLEDDEDARTLVRAALELRFQIEFMSDLRTLKERAYSAGPKPAALLAELQLRDGTSFLDVLKERSFVDHLSAPVLVVSGVEEVEVLRFCFARGVDDYLIKPANRIELLAKIERAVASRLATLGIRLNPITLTATRQGLTSAPLTPKEFQLTTVLLAAGVDAIAPAALREQLWPVSQVTAKALDVHMSHLRKKLAILGVRIERLPRGLLIVAVDKDCVLGA